MNEQPPEGIEKLKAYFRITPQDLGALAGLIDMAGSMADRLVEVLYPHLMAFPETRPILGGDETRARAREGHRNYLVSLFQGVCDEEYARLRQRIGEVHDRMGVEPWHYCGAMALVLTEMLPVLREALEGQPEARRHQVISALLKLVLLDAALVWQSFQGAREERLSQRVRELQALNQFASQRINELIEARDALERHTRDLQLIADAARTSFEEPDPRAAVRNVLGRVLDALEMEAAELWLVNPDGEELVLAEHVGLFPKEFGEVTGLKVGEDFPGLAAATGQPLVTADMAQESRLLRPAVKNLGLGFYASVPVKAGPQVVGVVCLASLRRQPWDDERASLIETVGSVIGRRTMAALADEIRRKGEALS